MLTKWTEIELFWLSTAKRLTDEERIAALDEYRTTGGMVDVVMAEPNPEDLSAEECERLSEAGPKSDEIDWTGFDAAEITDAQIEALRTEAGGAGDSAQVDICNRALEGDEAARTECARVIDDARSSAAQFQVQIRRVGIGGRWTPGVHGTINQTGQSGAFASSFESDGEAFEAAAMVRLEMGDDYEVRVANIG